MGSTEWETRNRTVCCRSPAKHFRFQQYAKASFTERPNLRVPSYKPEDQLDG